MHFRRVVKLSVAGAILLLTSFQCQEDPVPIGPAVAANIFDHSLRFLLLAFVDPARPPLTVVILVLILGLVALPQLLAAPRPPLPK